MRALGWMQKRFSKNSEQITKGSTSTLPLSRKSCFCLSSLWELDEQQHYPEENNNSAQFMQPVALEAHGVEIVNEEEIVDMKPELFQGLLAIGTLGSVIIAKDSITSEAAIDEEETSAQEKELEFLKKKPENLTENKFENDTKENTNMVVYSLKEHYEMPAIKESEKEFKKNATSKKRSGKLEKMVKRDTHVFPFLKKVLRKLDFTSRGTTTSGLHNNAIKCDSTKKIPTKVFRKSRKIHPEAADVQMNKSHKYEVKKICYDESYDKEVAFDDEDNMYHEVGMFKKETISSNQFAHKPFNVQTDERKPHWIKTDSDYVVLEF